MSVITIQEDFDGGPPIPPQHLGPGEARTFGRGGAGSEVDIALAPEDRAVSRRAGVIASGERHWRLTNTSQDKTYLVEHTDRIPGYVQVRPGMRDVVIPFETSRVRIPGVTREYPFLVMAPEQGPGTELGEASGAHTRDTRSGTLVAYRLDRWNTYFRVLVAFCEPQLRDPATPAVPTQPQVASRLGLTRSAVNAHIDYLLNQKLKVGQLGRGPGADWRPQTLTEYALRFGLVTADDLPLLPDHPAG